MQSRCSDTLLLVEVTVRMEGMTPPTGRDAVLSWFHVITPLFFPNPTLQEELANTISQLIHVVNNSEARKS